MIKSEYFFWLVGAVFVVMAAQMAMDRTNPKRFGSAGFWGACWAPRSSTRPGGRRQVPPRRTAGRRRPRPDRPRRLRPHRQGRVPHPPVPREARRLRRPPRQQAVPPPRAHHPRRRDDLRDAREELEDRRRTRPGAGLRDHPRPGRRAVAALAVGMLLLRERKISVPLHAGRNMLESMGWALLLPQLLSVLGSIFQAAASASRSAGSPRRSCRTARSSSPSPCTAAAWRCSPSSWATPSRRSR